LSLAITAWIVVVTGKRGEGSRLAAPVRELGIRCAHREDAIDAAIRQWPDKNRAEDAENGGAARWWA
jgi:hypothetical protein